MGRQGLALANKIKYNRYKILYRNLIDSGEDWGPGQHFHPGTILESPELIYDEFVKSLKLPSCVMPACQAVSH